MSQQISVTLYHVVGSESDLKIHVQNVGIPSAKTLSRKNCLFRMGLHTIDKRKCYYFKPQKVRYIITKFGEGSRVMFVSSLPSIKRQFCY